MADFPWTALVAATSLLVGFVSGAVSNAFRFGSFKTMCEGKFDVLTNGLANLNATAGKVETELRKLVVHEIHIENLRKDSARIDALERTVRDHGHDIRDLKHQLMLAHDLENRFGPKKDA